MQDFLLDIKPFFYRRPIVYVDVGAHTGATFATLLKSGLPINEAHLVEPDPASFAALKENLAKLETPKRLSLYNVAMGETEGVVRMLAADTMTKVVGSADDASMRNDHHNIFEAPVRSLDVIAQDFLTKHISVLKIDVEGFEEKVLAGAHGLLEREDIDVLYVEAGINPEGTQQCYYRTIEDRLRGYGYRLFKIYEQHFEWTEDNPLLRRVNLAFMSRKFADHNPMRLSQEIFKAHERISELMAAAKTAAAKTVQLEKNLVDAANSQRSAEKQLSTTQKKMKTAEEAAAQASKKAVSLEARLAESVTELNALRTNASWRVMAHLRALSKNPLAILRRRRSNAALRKTIAASGLFDGRWYLDRHPDVAAARVDPLTHYIEAGASEGREPCSGFSSAWYLSNNPDVAATGVNPLGHYIDYGKKEGRRPLPPGADEEPGGAKAMSSPREANGVFARLLAAIPAEAFPAELASALRNGAGPLADAAARLRASGQAPLVSIVMPTYNRAGVIGEAIASVIEQDYPNWELFVCDDASTDDTEALVAGFGDARIRYRKLEKNGAAAARNAGLGEARGEILAYLDSDNCWRPSFLSAMVSALLENPGRSAAYADFIDYERREDGAVKIRSFRRPSFDHEKLLQKNFIDLNSFVHRRELYDCFGGFNEALTRRQDYDLILKFTWLRDPLHIREPLTFYRRDARLGQITATMKADMTCVPIIENALAGYLAKGLPRAKPPGAKKKVTVLSWDMSRNHFAKPFSVAEALSEDYETQLISFRFFEEKIFPPLAGVKAPFETVYLEGAAFPDFFGAMKQALDAVTGDVLYVVKPRLPSLGLALLANYQREIPIILEINDLETVVSSPRRADRHREADFATMDLAAPDLLNPYSDLWSQVLDPVAKEIPALVTHNRGIDEHFGRRCLYMRNLKDERVFDPGRYDRAAVRAELGFGPEDRVIFFGGLLREHKGIHELVELVERLADPRYKLLFAGSRPNPDQKRLIAKYGERVRVLPPQNAEAMAKLNLAADLVILWLDPEVPASHYQMPYKASDALAMGPTIIANEVSDLKTLGEQGYLRLVAFGDWARMTETIRAVFEESEKTAAMRAAGRRLFQRQFSYPAARGAFALAVERALAAPSGPLPVAQAFTARFNEFYRLTAGVDADFVPPRSDLKPAAPAPTPKIKTDDPRSNEDEAIVLVDVKAIDALSHIDPRGVAVVMPCIDTKKGMETARFLARRAGMDLKVFVVEDTLRQGFIKTLNATSARLNVAYLVYLAEDAFPGLDWLRTAHDALERSGRGLLAFNCGKWKGRVAAFGMARMDWARGLYGGSVFYPGYLAHKADNELTVIARVTDQFVYEPNATLVEIDAGKAFVENIPEDKALFRQRFRSGFDGAVPLDRLKPLAEEYFVPWPEPPSGGSKKADRKAASAAAPKIAALKRDYDSKGLNGELDSFALYRIIGNDLYPRHQLGQSRENLAFILENEPALEACEKHFILNRIVNREEEEATMALLERHGAAYLRIPFEAEVYAKIGFDLGALPDPSVLTGPMLDTADDDMRGRLRQALYRLKNNYVMNNNGARNAALRHGRGRAEWIFPFDGNCFITSKAWARMRADIEAAPYLKYFIVPMTRVLDNSELLSPDFRPDPVEEPQIAFRRDAKEEFNTDFCYGRRPKVELFWRLGVPGKWDRYKRDPWDQPRRAISSEARQVGEAGWVARLYSGMASLEQHDIESTERRYFARMDAIISTLGALDQNIAGASGATLTALSAGALLAERARVAEGAGGPLSPVVEALLKEADAALARGPYSVIDKTTLPPSGEAQDYWHPAPYWHPNPDTPDGLPYIRKDGERVPGARLYEPESEQYDRTRLQRVFDDSFMLALAWKFSGEQRYADHGVRLLRRFFIDPETRMAPHLTYAQVRMGKGNGRGAASGLIEMKDLYYYLDAVRLLVEARAVSNDMAQTFKDWLGAYLEWLVSSPQGRGERAAANNHGTCYDLQVASIAAFLGERQVVYDALARSLSRIGTQFAADGAQPEELTRTTTAHYCCFNFQSWLNLADLADRWGVDLWGYEARSGASLKKGARWLLGHMGKPWPYQQIDAFDADRFHPIWFAANARLDGLTRPTGAPASKYDARPVFFPHDGVRPFWNLASVADFDRTSAASQPRRDGEARPPDTISGVQEGMGMEAPAYAGMTTVTHDGTPPEALRYVVLGGGKSGTTALTFSLREAFLRRYNVEPKISFEPKSAQKAFDADICKTLYEHYKVDPGAYEAAFEQYARRVLLVRDPRDTIVSRLLWQPQIYARDNVDKNDLVLDVIARKQSRPADLSVTQMFDEIGKIYGKSNWLAVALRQATQPLELAMKLNGAYFVYRYEQYISREFEELSAYLGLSIAPAEDLGRFARVRRSASTGDWRRWFLDEDIEMIVRPISELMIRAGYSVDERLSDDPVITPEESHEYVRNLLRSRKRKATL